MAQHLNFRNRYAGAWWIIEGPRGSGTGYATGDGVALSVVETELDPPMGSGPGSLQEWALRQHRVPLVPAGFLGAEM